MPSFYLNDTAIDRAEIDSMARRLASLLKDYGVGEEKAIAVLMRNDTVCMAIVEACRYLGARYAMLNWHATAHEIAHILEDSQAKVLIGHSDLLAALDLGVMDRAPILSIDTPGDVLAAYEGASAAALPVAVKSLTDLINNAQPIDGDPLRFRGMFAYTSGSTGRPKGIRRNTDPKAPDPYQVYAGLARDMLHAGEGDKLMVAAPLYHSAPHALACFALASGIMDLVIVPKFDPVEFLELLQRHKVTHVYIVPTMMVRLLKLPAEVRERYDLSALRFAVSTGSPWPVEVKQAMIDWLGPIFYESYGASELGFMTLISSEEATARPGSVGKILPGGSIKIYDDDGRECSPYEVGTIYVSLPLFGGFSYTNADGSVVDERIDGHATVGDMGHLDEDGYLFIGDRKKDMIISGGANIFPAEIEAELIKMPEVADCAVFGAPDAEFGEQVVAAVQCTQGEAVDLEAVKLFLTPLLAKFKIPRKLDIHEALPREDSGKIFKKRLRDPYWEHQKAKI
jgi:long-chain acyl-CoA synthetase